MIWRILCLVISLAGYSGAVCNTSEITYVPRETVVRRGDTVMIICMIQYHAEEDCDVSWFVLNHGSQSPKPLGNAGHRTESNTLPIAGRIKILTNLVWLRNVPNSRTYRCQARQGVFADTEVTVVDREDSEAVVLRPSVGDMPSHVYVRRGADIGIPCVARHNDMLRDVSFKWVRIMNGWPVDALYSGGNMATMDTSNYDIGLYTKVLDIRRAEKRYAGRYRCQLTDDIYKETYLVVV